MKSFFENPELLLGSPFLVIGFVGLVIALAAMFMYWVNPNPSGRHQGGSE
jgi:hypothetical protein